MEKRLEIDLGDIRVKGGNFYGTTVQGDTIKIELEDFSIDIEEGKYYTVNGYITTEFFKPTFHIERATEIAAYDFGLVELDLRNIKKEGKKYYGYMQDRDYSATIILENPYIVLEEGKNYRVKGHIKSSRLTFKINVIEAILLDGSLPRLDNDNSPECNISYVQLIDGNLYGKADNGDIVLLLPCDDAVKIKVGGCYRLKGQLLTQVGRRKEGIHDHTLQVEYVLKDYLEE